MIDLVTGTGQNRVRLFEKPMKTPRVFFLFPCILFATATAAWAAEAPAVPSWHAQTLGQAIANLLIFAGIGLVTAIVGYKIFDMCTPGHLTKEILEHRNVAAAIIGGAVILGVCIIVAAAMMG